MLKGHVSCLLWYATIPLLISYPHIPHRYSKTVLCQCRLGSAQPLAVTLWAGTVDFYHVMPSGELNMAWLWLAGNGETRVIYWRYVNKGVMDRDIGMAVWRGSVIYPVISGPRWGGRGDTAQGSKIRSESW